MRRMSVFTWMVIAVLAAGAAPLLTASEARAQTTLLDPGWQIYSENQNSGVSSGFIAQTFGDQSGQYTYQPAPRYRAPTSAAPRYSAPVYSTPAYYRRSTRTAARQSIRAAILCGCAVTAASRLPAANATILRRRTRTASRNLSAATTAAVLRGCRATARRLSATSHAILCTRSGAAGSRLATFAGLLPAADGWATAGRLSADGAAGRKSAAAILPATAIQPVAAVQSTAAIPVAIVRAQ